LELAPDDASILNDEALLYALKGDNEEAKALNEKALEKDPSLIPALDTKGFIFYNLEKYDEAADILTEAIGKNSRNKRSWYHMGDVYTKLNTYDDAIRAICSLFY
jgi:tetratricopeptide (TPR) repeat protein